MSFNFQNSSTISNEFYLEGSHFHRLDQLRTTETKLFTIKVHQKSFHLTKEQVYLISIKHYSSFQKNRFPIEIPIPSNADYPNISANDLQIAFEQIVYLFSTVDQI
jgi:hypothetical protein